MATPLDPLVAEMVHLLDANQREEFEERAGIVEFDGQKLRAHAECLALLAVLNRHPTALVGIAVLQTEIEGCQQWILTTDAEIARQHLMQIGGTAICAITPADVLEEYFDGVAWLVKR